MQETKFKAKACLTIKELDELDIPHQNGFVCGYYAGGYIMGDLIEANEEYIAFRWWVSIKEETLEQCTG